MGTCNSSSKSGSGRGKVFTTDEALYETPNEGLKWDKSTKSWVKS